jgi:hypothetical protein
MNKDKFIVIIEYAWILMAVFCLAAGIYYNIKIGIDKAWMIYSMSAISIGMFAVRRMQRKNLEKKQKRNNR